MRYIAITAIVLSLLVSIHAQTCDHTSNSKERFDAIRLLPPSKIFWDGKTVTARYEDKQGIYIEQLTTDNQTVLPKTFNKNRYYWVLFSLCDKRAETVIEVLPEQFK
jgi:hypothetical protein